MPVTYNGTSAAAVRTVKASPDRALPTDATLCEWLRSRGRDTTRATLAVLDPTQPTSLSAQSERDLRECLELLDLLRADEEVLLAAIVHALPAWRPRLGSLDTDTRGRVLVLLEGQQAAEQVWNLHAERTQHVRAEGLRRLLLALVKDLRTILILLARHLVRMRHAADLPEDQRVALAQLSADIHAPLANRLGIWQLKWELEDLAFRYLQPDRYQRIARLLDEKRSDRERFIESVKTRIRAALGDAGIVADVAGRPKHIFSIWKKMQRKNVPFGELYDVRAVRVLVDDIATCYAALGVVHQLWSPVPAEFDDYIANPKGNNYRSLHTAVIGPQGRALEVQIRTHDMHAHSELGVAAHWRYKEGQVGVGKTSPNADASYDRKIAWMRQLLDRGEAEGGEETLLAGLRADLVEDRVYLLTPRGEVIDLPRGGTVLDFAYHVHTEVGHRCRGAKVNGRIVPLNFQPATGDRVEIMTAKISEPRRDWLLAGSGFLASARSRDKVRGWFHKLDRARNLQAGRELLDKELKRLALHQHDLAPALARFRLATLDELHIAVALGDVGPSQVARALHDHAQALLRSETEKQAQASRADPKARPARPNDRFVVEGVGNLLTLLARCCQPVAGDAIAGYLTRGRGVSIHRQGCTALARLLIAHPERLLPVEWGERGSASYSVDVQVRGLDRKGLLKDLTNLIAQHGVHVLAVSSRLEESRGLAEVRFTLKVKDFDQLGQLLGRLGAVAGVDEARRLG
ncbi:MAG: bifunctional (p)ppGpp synthetase/guanosine-3',5'-bis(diphosphate) 3'-pyrophosphohydrolase [Proteobacteria bacterium]|nr:bifunctional (p)ppGpp synthetase/guanosine-3',5'-bis(diphosphate) 3'-pyrophosphohydrolase [Pseudomonadota bacterium]